MGLSDASCRLRRSRMAMAIAVSFLLIGIGVFIFTHPQEFSDLFLRSGGRFVSDIVEKPQRTASVFAVLLTVLWLGIGVRCMFEAFGGRADRAGSENPPTDPPSAS